MNPKFILCFFLAVGAASFSSCKKKVSGCTDIVADNFNGDATEDDGSCIYSKHIGDSYQGGIIFYVDLTGQHGLIAATTDQSDGISWLVDTTIVTYANYTNIFKGRQNTNTIVGLQGAGNYAAKICDDLVLNGYDDWYLPAKSELKEMYDQRTVVGNLAPEFYWSSTENDNDLHRDLAWYHKMDSIGHENCNYKGYLAHVRAVRNF